MKYFIVFIIGIILGIGMLLVSKRVKRQNKEVLSSENIQPLGSSKFEKLDIDNTPIPDKSNLNELEVKFTQAMHGVYYSALQECHYKATYFLKMVNDLGGLQTARILLHKRELSYGFEKLWECGCLHITMEALILKEPWEKLFTEEEKEIARKRLRDCGYKF